MRRGDGREEKGRGGLEQLAPFSSKLQGYAVSLMGFTLTRTNWC